mgnify:CR=1 FL=1
MSGKVESLNIAHRNTDAAGQLEDIRNLIQAGVDRAQAVDAGDGIRKAISPDQRMPVEQHQQGDEGQQHPHSGLTV